MPGGTDPRWKTMPLHGALNQWVMTPQIMGCRSQTFFGSYVKLNILPQEAGFAVTMSKAAKIRKKLSEFRRAERKAYWLWDQVRWRYFTFRHRKEALLNSVFDRDHGIETAVKHRWGRWASLARMWPAAMESTAR